VQDAGLGQWAGSLLQEVGDVFAAINLVFVDVLERAGDFVGAVDFDQRQDFLYVVTGVESVLLEFFVVIGCLRAKT
jgi:hypothetical protein